MWSFRGDTERASIEVALCDLKSPDLILSSAPAPVRVGSQQREHAARVDGVGVTEDRSHDTVVSLYTGGVCGRLAWSLVEGAGLTPT